MRRHELTDQEWAVIAPFCRATAGASLGLMIVA